MKYFVADLGILYKTLILVQDKLILFSFSIEEGHMVYCQPAKWNPYKIPFPASSQSKETNIHANKCSDGWWTWFQASHEGRDPAAACGRPTLCFSFHKLTDARISAPATRHLHLKNTIFVLIASQQELILQYQLFWPLFFIVRVDEEWFNKG